MQTVVPNFNFTLAQLELKLENENRKSPVIVFGGLCVNMDHTVTTKIPQESHSVQNKQGNHFLLEGAVSNFSPRETATEHCMYPKTKSGTFPLNHISVHISVFFG